MFDWTNLREYHIRLVLCCAFFAISSLPQSASADTATVNGITWTYTVSGGKASLGSGSYWANTAISTSTSGAITIPSTLGGCPVADISNYAFYNCSGLTSVTIPDSVTRIGDDAFLDCRGLTSVTIPESVTSIGNWAFQNCSGLTSVTIPDGVTSIGKGAFCDCSGLTSVTIPDSVTSIGDYAFYGCSGLTTVTIPDSVTSIGDDAFFRCTNLVSINIPSIEAWLKISFEGAYSNPCWYAPLLIGGNHVENVKVPSYIHSISAWAFCENRDLNTIEFNGPITSIGAGAFRGSTLSAITLPIGIERIEDSTFQFCSQLHSVEIPGTVKSIGKYAFDSCDALTAISIPDSVTNIDQNAFLYCRNLKSLLLPAHFDGKLGGLAIPTSCVVAFRPDCNHAISCAGKFVFINCSQTDWATSLKDGTTDDYCLRSGEIDVNEMSSVETTITGKGTLSFKWKVPAGRGDYARVYLDGEVQKSIQRVTAWQTVSLDIPAGEHTIRWSYERGSGSAAGEDAAFLDDVDWRPEVSLSVASAFGTTTPATGPHILVYGDEVTTSVVEPAADNGTRLVCTGWTGTGSVPADGTESTVSFTITNDTSVVWNWRTDRWIDVSVSGGSCDFPPQWVADGTQVAVRITPATHLYAISLSGDTQGATLDGTTLRFSADKPRNIRVTVEEVKVSLAVESQWGVPSPTNGLHSLSWGTSIRAAMDEPEPANGVRYVCTGWTGTGSVPASGEGTNAVFMMETDSSLRWNWQTNVLVSLAVVGPASADFAAEWRELGTAVVATWTPTVPYFTVSLSGDSDGAVIDAAERTLTIPADRPRTILLEVQGLTLGSALDHPGLVWMTDGVSEWFPQVETSADGADSAKSGIVPDGDSASSIQTKVVGPGTFAWTWRLDSAGNAGVDVLLDGDWLASYAPGAGWSRETLNVTGEGEHVIRFEFWNAGTAATRSDCAYLDQVSWSGSVPSHDIVVEGVSIPSGWFETAAAPIRTQFGGDCAAAATATAANGINKVWECYVAGISPTNAAARFEAKIDIVDGKPFVSWLPDLNEGGTKTERIYTVEGKESLSDEWGATNNSSRFFRVQVSLPE